jgi:nitrite reductase/ring-hydroxylating ferredoxin subunit/uncharacterized membrane protein
MSEPMVDRVLRRQGWLDGPADAVQGAVGGVYGVLGRPGIFLKNVLHGTTMLRHPLHPALTDVPLGAWTAGVVADIAAQFTRAVPPAAGDVALAVGIVGALGAALSGYTDFHETYGTERRVALTHGLTMTVVLILELVSIWLRWAGPSGSRGLAVGIAIVALLIALAGAYLGGHLTFGFGTMVNRLAFAEGPGEFVTVGKPADFPENSMRRVQADGMPVLVVRLGGRLWAIANTCSHAGGPLDEGTLEGEVVTCPWHGSQFRMRDGQVRRGPATFGQPRLLVRELEGRVEVKLAEPLH